MKTRLCFIFILTFLLSPVTRSTNNATAHNAEAPQTAVSASLVIGVPGEDIGISSDAGAVNVLYNSGSGLYALGSQFWNQGSPGVDTVHNRASFGKALAVGDFNGDGHDDLAIGILGKKFGTTNRVGMVIVMPGSQDIVNPFGTVQSWTQDSPGIPDTAETLDEFGSALAIGNFGRPFSLYLPVVRR
jgi:hypothetical protein